MLGQGAVTVIAGLLSQAAVTVTGGAAGAVTVIGGAAGAVTVTVGPGIF